jgi:site-specific recombinase XerD
VIEEYLAMKRVGARYVGKAGAPKTILAYRFALQAVERLLGKTLLEITEEDSDVLMVEMHDYEASYKAVILAALRGYYTWAIAMGRYKGSHPFAHVRTPKISRKIPTILTKEELHVFFNSFSDEKYRLFFELMYYAGLRIGEVCQLQINDLTREGINVRGKGDKQRFVPLPLKIRNALSEYRLQHNESIFLFYAEAKNGDKNTPLTLAQAYKVFHRAVDDACIPHIHPHNLRHTSATHFHEAVGDLATTQKFLGHADPNTTTIYAQIADSRMKSAHAKAFGE